jgi:antitoxin component YwqK of YwqJK toxin-antitoxin module
LVEEFYDNGQLKRKGNWKNGKENKALGKSLTKVET